MSELPLRLQLEASLHVCRDDRTHHIPEKGMFYGRRRALGGGGEGGDGLLELLSDLKANSSKRTPL